MKDQPAKAALDFLALAINAAKAEAQTLFHSVPGIGPDPYGFKIGLIERSLTNLCTSFLGDFTALALDEFIAKTKDAIDKHHEKYVVAEKNLLMHEVGTGIEAALNEVKRQMDSYREEVEEIKDSDTTDKSGDESDDEDIIGEDNREIGAMSGTNDAVPAESSGPMDVDVDANTSATSKTPPDPPSSPYDPADDPGRRERANDGKTERFNPLNRPPFLPGPPQARPQHVDTTVDPDDPVQGRARYDFGTLPSRFKPRDGEEG